MYNNVKILLGVVGRNLFEGQLLRHGEICVRLCACDRQGGGRFRDCGGGENKSNARLKRAKESVLLPRADSSIVE